MIFFSSRVVMTGSSTCNENSALFCFNHRRQYGSGTEKTPETPNFPGFFDVFQVQIENSENERNTSLKEIVEVYECETHGL